MILGGSALILLHHIRSFRLYRRQSMWVLTGVVVPLVVNMIYVFRLIPGLTRDYSSVGFAFAGLMFGVGIFRYRLLDVRPIARNLLIDSMSDAMMVLDELNHIVDLNPAAQAILGLAPGAVIGQPAEAVLKPWPYVVEQFAGVNQARTELPLAVHGEPRWYDFRISPVQDRAHRPVGRLITLRDITE